MIAQFTCDEMSYKKLGTLLTALCYIDPYNAQYVYTGPVSIHIVKWKKQWSKYSLADN